MTKNPEAFRTIREVADELDLPQHVLRFWETRFPQIKPVKNSGGRRYYRPEDVDLIQGIKTLLYDEGYTIKGVQRILKEKGTGIVQNLKPEDLLPDDEEDIQSEYPAEYSDEISSFYEEKRTVENPPSDVNLYPDSQISGHSSNISENLDLFSDIREWSSEKPSSFSAKEYQKEGLSVPQSSAELSGQFRGHSFYPPEERSYTGSEQIVRQEQAEKLKMALQELLECRRLIKNLTEAPDECETD